MSRPPARIAGASFASRIKLVRESLGLGQEELAERLAISQQTVSLWESGQRTPGRRSWALIEHRLGYTQEQLVRGKGFRPPEPRLAESPDKRHLPLHLVPPQAGTDVMRISPSGLVAEALSLADALKTVRDAVKTGRAVWIVVD